VPSTVIDIMGHTGCPFCYERDDDDRRDEVRSLLNISLRGVVCLAEAQIEGVGDFLAGGASDPTG